jgi:hypothetical protein
MVDYQRVPTVLVCIALWYTTNAFCAVATQRCLRDILAMNGNNGDAGDSLVEAFQLSSALTAIQLAVGALLGLLVLTMAGGTLYAIGLVSDRLHSTSATLCACLVVLHGLASCSTTIGFYYGSASLVQVIKASEPMMTLAIAYAWGIVFQPRIRVIAQQIAAMGIVVLAMSTLLTGNGGSNDKSLQYFASIAFSLISGIFLATRNVVQKGASLVNTIIKTDYLPVAQSEKEAGQAKVAGDVSAIILPQLVDFVVMSTGGAIVCIVIALLNVAFAYTSGQSLLQWDSLVFSYAAVLLHGAYNMFSLIVLGVSSSIRHLHS